MAESRQDIPGDVNTITADDAQQDVAHIKAQL